MRPENPQATDRPRGRPSRGVRHAILAAVRELIREQGLASVTTAAVAQRASASQASIHYHFGGKEGLLEHAILDALEPLQTREEPTRGQPLAKSLGVLAATLERAYDELIPLLVAVQSDPDLRRQTAPSLASHDLGPHRAVALVARHLKVSQADGEAGASCDADAAALLLVGACFLRAWQRQMSTHRSAALPGLPRAIAVLVNEDGDHERRS